MGLSQDARASALRQKLRDLEVQRTRCLDDLLEARLLFAASLSVVYRTCGKPSCSCTQGKKHGPYFFLSIQSAGRNDRYHVSRHQAENMRPAIDRYRAFVRGLRRLRSVDRNIEGLLRRLQTLCETRSTRSFGIS
jgi:hypothetical protein